MKVKVLERPSGDEMNFTTSSSRSAQLKVGSYDHSSHTMIGSSAWERSTGPQNNLNWYDTLSVQNIARIANAVKVTI